MAEFVFGYTGEVVPGVRRGPGRVAERRWRIPAVEGVEGDLGPSEAVRPDDVPIRGPAKVPRSSLVLGVQEDRPLIVCNPVELEVGPLLVPDLRAELS